MQTMTIEQVRQLIWASDYKSCVVAARALIKQEPEHYEAWYILAECLKQQTQYRAALAATIKVLNHIPNQPYAAAVLVECCAQLGLADIARPYLDQLVFDDRPSELATHANYYFGLGFEEEGLRRVRCILELFPDDLFALYTLGAMQLTQGHITPGMLNYQVSQTRRFHEQYRSGMQQNGWDLERSWEGESVEGKTVLVLPYGGVGDYLQFIRYAQQLKLLGAARVLVHLPNNRFRGLIESAQGVD